MALRSLPLSHPLSASSRLGIVAGRLGVSPLAEVLTLVFLGVAAAVITLNVDLDLRVPGHAILKSVFPLALGFALVPRGHAGSVMGSAALAVVLVQGNLRGGQGFGTATSLVLTGPILDLLVRRAGSGRGVYAAFIVGGLLANASAFAVRLGAKLLFHDGGRPLALWWPEAILTYALCGVAAGVVSAAVWFRLSGPPSPAR